MEWVNMRDIVVIDRRYDTLAEKLNKAKKVKNDEYYTQYSDIQKELEHYDKDKFNNKVIYLPCDRPQSNFVAYFKEHYEYYKYKELIYTYIAKEENEEVFEYSFDGKKEKKTKLRGNGAFQSDECIEIMKRADWVITNPPFSILGIFIDQLLTLGSKFLICVPLTKLKDNNVFEKIKNKELYTGYTHLTYFLDSNNNLASVNVLWLTTEKINKVKQTKKLTYKLIKYDNYNALECSKLVYLEDIIARGLNGTFGVPITILDSYIMYLPNIEVIDKIHPTINGKKLYDRIIIEIK